MGLIRLLEDFSIKQKALVVGMKTHLCQGFDVYSASLEDLEVDGPELGTELDVLEVVVEKLEGKDFRSDFIEVEEYAVVKVLFHQQSEVAHEVVPCLQKHNEILQLLPV